MPKHNVEREDTGWDRNATAEALVDPEPIEDSLQDILRELIHPEKLSDVSLEKVVQFLDKRKTEEGNSAQGHVRIRAILRCLRPKPVELADRWAFNFVTGDPSVNGITTEMVSQMLGLHKSTVKNYVHRWRKILNYKAVGSRSQANHIGHRTRRAKSLKS